MTFEFLLIIGIWFAEPGRPPATASEPQATLEDCHRKGAEFLAQDPADFGASMLSAACAKRRKAADEKPA